MKFILQPEPIQSQWAKNTINIRSNLFFWKCINICRIDVLQFAHFDCTEHKRQWERGDEEGKQQPAAHNHQVCRSVHLLPTRGLGCGRSSGIELRRPAGHMLLELSQFSVRFRIGTASGPPPLWTQSQVFRNNILIFCSFWIWMVHLKRDGNRNKEKKYTLIVMPSYY